MSQRKSVSKSVKKSQIGPKLVTKCDKVGLHGWKGSKGLVGGLFGLKADKKGFIGIESVCNRVFLLTWVSFTRNS